jgi:APA family basic amino acid/polyamine antiporter
MTQGSDRVVLPRVLGRAAAWSMVVGSVIGSGIFIVPARVARDVPSVGPILLVWIVGGLLSLAGALPLAELGAMLPRAGGPYVYLKEAYGRLPAFLFGWTEFLVIRAGSIATLAAAFALYFSQLIPAPEPIDHRVWLAIVASAATILVATLNIMGTRASGWVQTLGTILKVGALVTMMILPFVLEKASFARLEPIAPRAWDPTLLTGALAAMVGVLWTYDGWVNTSELAEEIRDPGRTVPFALIFGVIVLIALYLGTTIAYHLVLPMNEMAEIARGSGEGPVRGVAAVFFERLLGNQGATAIALVVMASTFIALNGNALAGPRTYFALARDGLAPRWLSHVHSRFQTPAAAIAAQAAWAVILTALGTIFLVYPPPSEGLPNWAERAWETLHRTPLYDVLYTFVIFGGTAIYTLTMTSIFVLRRKQPARERPYRCWGYPWTPLFYVGAMLYLLYSMLSTTLIESLAGLGIIALGIPAYGLYLGLRRPLPSRFHS